MSLLDALVDEMEALQRRQQAGERCGKPTEGEKSCRESQRCALPVGHERFTALPSRCAA